MPTNAIAAINDTIRTEGTFGDGYPSRVVLTRGVAALGEDMLRSIMLAFMQFSDFTTGMDPDGTHDMGEMGVFGHRIWFKMDPHPTVADARIITFMRPDEY